MKQIICFMTLLFISICSYSQIQYAMYTGNKSVSSPNGKLVDISLYKNTALISNALIKLKGDDWYTNHILNNESFPKKMKYAIACFVDTIIIERENKLTLNNPELRDAISEVCRYLYSQHSNIYIYSPSFNFKKDKFEYLKLIHNYIERMKESPNDKNPIIYYIYNGFIGTIDGTRQFWYNKYRTKEFENGNIPLSHIDWIKSQIDYYMNLQIDSSLDYGIDNSAFIIN